MWRLVLILCILGAIASLWWGGQSFPLLTETLAALSPSLVLTVFILLGFNELLKGTRWVWYLRAARLPIRPFDGLTSYLAAQAASTLPGGSLLSARLAEEHGHGRIGLRHTTPPLLVQGIGDLTAVALLAVVGIVVTPRSNYQLLAPLSALLLVGLVLSTIRSPRLGAWLTTVLGRRGFTRRLLPAEEDARHVLLVLTRPPTLLVGISFSIGTSLLAAATIVTLADALTMRGLSPLEGIYAHAMSMLAHLLVPMPNGYGTSDLGLAGSLNLVGIGFARATAVAVTYRAINTGFRTAVGLLVLLTRYHHLLRSAQPVTAVQTPPTPYDLAAEGRD